MAYTPPQAEVTQPNFIGKRIAVEVDKTTLIGKLGQTMDDMAYQVLVDVANWSKMIDDVHNSKVEGGLTENYMRAMCAVFSGFGNIPQAWATYAGLIIPVLTNTLMRWREDEVYRAANPSFYYLTLVELSPSLAAVSKGHEGMREAYRIIAEHGPS